MSSLGDAVKAATADWQREVDAETVRLIESGTPPFDAATQARDIVARRRHDKQRNAFGRASQGETE